MNLKSLLLLCCFALVSLVVAEEQPAPLSSVEEPHQDETSLSNFPGMPELTLSDGVMRAVSVAGAMVTAVAGLAAIMSFFLPMLGFKMCMVTGGCEEATPYNSNSVYDQQGFGPYQYNNGFKRRSLEYVGPILKALTSAYDKYGPPAQARKLSVKPADGK